MLLLWQLSVAEKSPYIFVSIYSCTLGWSVDMGFTPCPGVVTHLKWKYYKQIHLVGIIHITSSCGLLTSTSNSMWRLQSCSRQGLFHRRWHRWEWKDLGLLKESPSKILEKAILIWICKSTAYQNSMLLCYLLHGKSIEWKIKIELG